MSRQLLADLASSVEGLDVKPYYSQTLRQGHGYIAWAGRESDDDALGWIETWQVVVSLPKEVAKAEEWIDTRLIPLITAIESHRGYFVVRAVPADLALATATTNGLVVEVQHNAR